MANPMLRPLYDQAVAGLPLLGTPSEVAARLQHDMEADAAADQLVRQATTLSSATGFVCGLPGYLSMPLTIPSNVAGVLLIQFHLCATLAALGGRDPRAAEVRDEAIRCVLDDDTESDDGARAERRRASSDTTSSKNFEQSDREVSGLLGRVATKLGERGVRFIGEQATRWIYKAAHHARRGGRGLPLLGGAIGAVTDGVATQTVGRRARRAFLQQRSTHEDGEPS